MTADRQPYNETETRRWLIDPVLDGKGYNDSRWLKLETPAPVEATGHKGRRRPGKGFTDYLLCVQVADWPKPLPIAVLEAKKEDDDPLKGLQQGKSYQSAQKNQLKYAFASNGHRYGEYDAITGLHDGPFPLTEFPDRASLTARYAADHGIDLDDPQARMLGMADSPAWSAGRYYQDAAIRAVFEKILQCRALDQPPRALLSLATGAGKTVIATNLLWRLQQAGLLDKPALFLCDRDELREQAHSKLAAAFGDNARIVRTERGHNAARNARIHIATYQTLGLDDDADQADNRASFLSEHYADNAFSVIIIDECHRSAWGRWSEVLRRNADAIHIGLTATPRQLRESQRITAEDQEITANNHQYFGAPVYEYTLIQAQQDGYLAACEIVRRKASIDNRVFSKQEILDARATDLRSGRLITEEDLTKNEYTGKDFDDELFIDLRTPTMCADLFDQLCQNGGPEQKVIIFCTREIHADRVAMQLNNLYRNWCRQNGHTPKDHYAFKCMGGQHGGSEMIEPLRGSADRAFIACTVDLLEAGVDIERLNAVVFFRYLQSPIKFYQMVGRGTRIHEATGKYKFWLYDYSDVTELFGTEFITAPPPPYTPKPGGDDTTGGGVGGDGGDWPPGVAEICGQPVDISPRGRFILSEQDGRDVPIPVEDYRRELIARVLREAHSLAEFRELWITAPQRRAFIDHLLGDNYSPELLRELDNMAEFDLYDCLSHHSYKAQALTQAERGEFYLQGNQHWFADLQPQAATVLQGLGRQFAAGGTEALESPTLWQVPEIHAAGGLQALKAIDTPKVVMREAKTRLFGL